MNMTAITEFREGALTFTLNEHSARLQARIVNSFYRRAVHLITGNLPDPRGNWRERHAGFRMAFEGAVRERISSIGIDEWKSLCNARTGVNRAAGIATIEDAIEYSYASLGHWILQKSTLEAALRLYGLAA